MVSILLLGLMLLVNSGLVLAVHHCHISETTTFGLALGAAKDDPCMDASENIEAVLTIDKEQEIDGCCSKEAPQKTSVSANSGCGIDITDDDCCESDNIEIDIDEFIQAQKLDNIALSIADNQLFDSEIEYFIYDFASAYLNINSPPELILIAHDSSINGNARQHAISIKSKIPASSDSDSDSDAPAAA